MTFLVPFDGSELSKAALARAREYGDALDEDVTAVSVVPTTRRYARKKGWVEAGEPLDVDEVVATLHRSALEVAPDASFRSIRVDGSITEGAVSTRLRKKAVEVGATVLFVGSANMGRVVSSVSNVSSGLAANTTYDVHIVRHA